MSLVASPASRLAAGVGRLKSAMRLSMRFAYANALPGDLFTENIKLPRVKELFAKYVRLVEIENHSYCNRTCSFCPNSSLDRLSRVVPIEGTVYDRIIADLASINYDQTLVWARDYSFIPKH